MTTPTDDEDAGPAAVLLDRQRTLTRDLQRALDDLQGVRDARSGQSDDDEHDPEGATLSSQWSHTMGIRTDLEARLGEVDRALARVEQGTYGFCQQCSAPILGARLEARPAAERCVACAASHPR